ncbi:MAG: hypothetical protein ACYTGX_05305 [Planctomycetota bacterium]|jgi:hypothetical protein
MAGYVTALPDPDAASACGASLAALWAEGSGPVLLDASCLPNRDDGEACVDGETERRKVTAFLEALTGGGRTPWVLPQVIGESVGMLDGLLAAWTESWDESLRTARDGTVALLRRGAHTGGALDSAWIRKCVRFLDALDRSETLSKEPGMKGRRTDLRLVAIGLHEAWLKQRASMIATRDEDIRRLAQGVASWNAAQPIPRPAPSVRVFKLDREAGVYRCYFDGAVDVPPPLTHPGAAEVAEAWAALT